MTLRPLARRGVVRTAASVILVAAALLVGGAVRGETADTAAPSIVVGTKSSPEDSLLGQLYAQALEARGFKVEYRQNIGSAAVIDRALRSGKIDIYPEYTGVIVRTLFHRAISTETATATYRLAKKLQEARGLTLLNPTPFVHASSIAMLSAIAAKYGVKSLYDLRSIPNLAIGTGPGLAGLQRKYKLTNLRFVPLRGVSPFAALASGTVLAAEVVSTDPSLGQGSKYRLLKDPMRQFSLENAAPVVTKAVVSALGSRFIPALNAVTAKLTQIAIRTMMNAVLVGKQSPANVANAFLSSHGLISSANVFVASNGSDTGVNCKRFATAVANPDRRGASLCKSFAKAYLLADAGDTVEVQAGDYPSQTITAKPRATAPNVVIRPASEASVTVDDLHTNGDHLTIEDITVATGGNHNRGWESTASDITLDGVAITGPYARVDIGGGATDVTWKNGSLGTPGNTISRVCGLNGGPSSDQQPVEISRVTNLTFSNLDFYPFIAELSNPACGPDSVMHLETIRVNDGVENFRLERSRFHRGDGSGTARLFITKLGGSNSDNLTVVNNWFGAADGKGGGSVSVDIGVNQACVNYVFAYNQFEQGFVPLCNPMTGLKLVGNTGVGPAYLCEGTTHIRNLWTWSSAGTCGSDRWIRDSNHSLAALRYAPDGYHLLAKSPAIDAGGTTECAALTGGLDIDGQLRVGTCDAGPDEFKKP